MTPGLTRIDQLPRIRYVVAYLKCWRCASNQERELSEYAEERLYQCHCGAWNKSGDARNRHDKGGVSPSKAEDKMIEGLKDRAGKEGIFNVFVPAKVSKHVEKKAIKKKVDKIIKKKLEANKVNVGERIREAMECKGFTLRELVEKLGVSYARVYRFTQLEDMPKRQTPAFIDVARELGLNFGDAQPQKPKVTKKIPVVQVAKGVEHIAEEPRLAGRYFIFDTKENKITAWLE